MLAAVSSAAAQSTSAGAPGVNPKDNITKGELFYRFDRLDGGESIQALAFKFDHAFNASVEANVEVPPIRLNTPGDDFSGLGDIALRVRHVRTAGPWSVIVAAEAALPTASRDKLGRGKWQLNPVAGVVYAFTPTTFAFLGYKHSFFGGRRRYAARHQRHAAARLAGTRMEKGLLGTGRPEVHQGTQGRQVGVARP